MRTPDLVLDWGSRLARRVHGGLVRLTRGRFPRQVLGMQPVELHTIGRRSGQRRSTFLAAPICDDERIVLVASKGGASEHPDWYKNLVAHPEIDITVGDRTTPMRARTASADEKAALWPKVVSSYKGYATYQRNTNRDIPIVVCEPIEPR